MLPCLAVVDVVAQLPPPPPAIIKGTFANVVTKLPPPPPLPLPVVIEGHSPTKTFNTVPGVTTKVPRIPAPRPGL